MVSTPGRLHVDGYRTSNYGCPLRRNTKKCNNPTVNDIVIGEFVINYILNMLNAKKTFSTINTPDELNAALLSGSVFSEVSSVEKNGLNSFFNLLSRYGSDRSYIFSVKSPRKKKAAVDPELSKLRKEKEKQERALQRLQDLYLYSETSMSEKDFIIRKSEISSHLDNINRQLGLMTQDQASFLSDEEFIKQASHLLIQKELKNKKYIYFKKLVNTVDPDILKAYMETILDSIYTADGKITAITFKNGLTHRFIYKDK